MIDAVIFDLGGVVFESPLHIIAAYERQQHLEPGVVNRVVAAAGADGAWARRERGQLGFEDFCVEFGAECAAAGASVDVAELLGRIDRDAVPRPRMIDAVIEIRSGGRKVAALTNNWVPLADHSFLARFDVVVESSVEGVRKPEEAIYRRTLDRLGVAAERTVFLDDIGANLKPARAMGMTTIKVVDPDEALVELRRVLGD